MCIRFTSRAGLRRGDFSTGEHKQRSMDDIATGQDSDEKEIRHLRNEVIKRMYKAIILIQDSLCFLFVTFGTIALFIISYKGLMQLWESCCW